MTAVAPPVTFQPSSRLGWTSNTNGFGAMNSDDVSRMFASGARKPMHRQNSASSISSNGSTISSNSTLSASSVQAMGTGTAPTSIEPGSWATRKKPTRALWPPVKAEPAIGISTARPQTINSSTSATSASSAMSAVHAPLVPSQPLVNGTAPSNGLRNSASGEPMPILHLLPMNGSFERKSITVPYYPDVLRIGRQTNQKTIPTPLNGYFDSKVLSRQHAEVYADRQGHIMIRDVKSSNGTFVNGIRLSPESKESEPRELKEQDVLELGIDIVSEDQKTVVHHKVAAKVEHAGIYVPLNEGLNFGDLEPGVGHGGLMAGPPHLKRSASQGMMNGRGPMAAGFNQLVGGMSVMNQPQHMRNWLNPITTEQIVKKLNVEMKLAMQQSDDLARARQSIEAMLGSKQTDSPMRDKSGSERNKSSPIQADLKSHFSNPPAPPPSAPLPEKPDVLRALADPVILPLLRRNDTVHPPSATNSPTRTDHSSDILRLCEELKLAKGELSSQNERMKTLENELAQERTARESAEERAQRLEQGGRKDSPRDSYNNDIVTNTATPDLQRQLDRLYVSMDEMKQQMEAFRQRAEAAETERDEAHRSLAEMIEQKRKENADETGIQSISRSLRSPLKRHPPSRGKEIIALNGHAVSPAPSSPTSDVLLERAGVEEGQPITPEQAKILTQFLTREVLHNTSPDFYSRAYYGVPFTSAAAVILLGVVLLNWGNGWPKIDR